jgi:hypothetical protein
MSYRTLYTYAATIALLGMTKIGYGQVSNDICKFAKALPVPNNYCSADGEFTNVGAQPDAAAAITNCLGLTFQNGVWFSFVPKEPAVLIRIFGSGQGGSMKSPRVIVYEDCNTYLNCSKGNTIGNEELAIVDLNIGQTYFLLVESAVGGEGTFKLCLDDFIPVPSPQSDCKDAVILCSKDPFKVESITGSGTDKNEIETGNCLFGPFPNAPAETASTWYKWTCDSPGSLTFVLTPNDYRSPDIESTDLDFAVYELPNGIDDCSNKKVLRCVASGEDGGLPFSSWSICYGPTGLREGDPDITERSGCKLNNQNNNAFASPINMEAGKSYVLIVNNFAENTNGFSIEFGGTGTFLGPKVDFEINAQQKFECDKTVTFIDKSTSATDPIVKYSWNFGARSTPNRASFQGPIDVTYSGFGDKTAALTVESSRGCSVTKIIDFYVDPCCKDTSTLGVSARAVDLRCTGTRDGEILANGFSGNGEYQYSIDGINYQPNPNFTDLDPGVYSIYIYDLKGCRDTTYDVTVREPLPIIVDAGPDQDIELGETTIMSGTYTTPIGLDSLHWTPALDFDINGITNPEVFPKTTTTYTFIVTDENGCTKTDQITIRVKAIYEIVAPNIFTPKDREINSPNNDFFNIWVNRAVKYVELLEVYDRWGNLVYQDRDVNFTENPGLLTTSSTTHGWNGYFNDKFVNPGVFAWRAKVRFIDETLKEFKGDVTILK